MSQQNKAKIVGLVVVALLATGATTGVVLINNKHNGSSSLSGITSSLSTLSTTSTIPSHSTSIYKNGNYTAWGSFDTPDGTEQIGVTVQLSNNNITSVSVDDSSIYSGTSFAYTERFISGLNLVVVGKNIDTVNVGRISGASLTPIGFNAALDAIKSQAKV